MCRIVTFSDIKFGSFRPRFLVRLATQCDGGGLLDHLLVLVCLPPKLFTVVPRLLPVSTKRRDDTYIHRSSSSSSLTVPPPQVTDTGTVRTDHDRKRYRSQGI